MQTLNHTLSESQHELDYTTMFAEQLEYIRGQHHFTGITFVRKYLFVYVHKSKCLCAINSWATFVYRKTYGKRNEFISKWAACIIGYGSLINNGLYKPQWIQPLECYSSESQGVHNPQYFL